MKCYSKYLSLGLILCLSILPLAAQITVELDHPNDGATSFGVVTYTSPFAALSNVTVTQAGGAALDSWIDFTATDAADGLSVEVTFFVANAECIPTPVGTCGDAICTGADPAFAAAAASQCYPITVNAYGVANAQTICIFGEEALEITNPVGGADIHLNAAAGGSAGPTAIAINQTGGNYTWAIEDLTAPADANVSLSSTTGNSTNVTFNAPGGAAFNGTYRVSVSDEHGCETDQLDVIATGTFSTAADFALVLDVSGSMGGDACNECANSKLQKLITAAQTVVDGLHGLAAGHRISVTIFARDLDGFNGGAIQEVSGSLGAIKGYLDGLTSPGINTGWTMMGGGLDQAIARLVSNVNPRNIILITDGQQNRDPSVEEDRNSPNYLHITNTDNTDSGITPSGTNLNNLSYPIHTIGLGLNADTDDLLSAISSATDGFAIHLQLSDTESRINTAVTTELTTALQGLGSPQIVDYRWRTMSAATATEAFPVNDYVQQVEFYLVYDWADEEVMDFVVQKGTQTFGRNTNRRNWSYTSGRGYKRFEMDFRLGGPTAGVLPGGEWKVQVRGAAGKKYEVYAVVDDHILDYSTTTGSNFTYAGSNMLLAVDLDYGGIPLEGATVTAYVFEPGESLSTLLSTTALPGDSDFSNINLGNNKGGRYGYKYLEKGDSGYYISGQGVVGSSSATNSRTNVLNESNATAIDLKIGTLMQNADFQQALLASQNAVPLNEVTPGRYENNYRVEVTGPYMVVYRIEGDDPKLGGRYERFQLASKLVETGPISLGNAGFFVYSYNNPQLLYLRPQDEFGNYLGLGMENYIDFEVTNAPASGVNTSIRGDMQGGYLIQIDGMPAGTKPELDITIGEHSTPTYSGSIEGIYRPFGIVASLGATRPLEEMDTLYNGGLMLEAGIEYLFTRKFGIQINGGYYGFDPSHNVLGVSGYLRYDFPFNRTDLNVTAGLGGGYYKPKGADGTFGFSGKLGLQRYLRPNVAAKLDLGYFSASTTPLATTFGTISLGVKWAL